MVRVPQETLRPGQKQQMGGGLLEYLAFDIFPLHLMFLLSALINVTLVFMSVAVHRELGCKLSMKSAKLLYRWQGLTKRRSSPPRRKAC